MDQLRTKLEELYYDASKPAGFAGARRLVEAAGKKRETETRAWLRGVPAYTLHRPAPTRFRRRKTIVNGPGKQVQVDLVDVQSLSSDNDGVKYLLTAVDAFSRKAWVHPLKTKTGAEVARVLEKLLDDTPFRLVQTDKGKEFYNVNVTRVFESRGTRHFSTENETIKASIVERFNRSLKDRVYRYMTHSDGQRYVDVLQSFVDSYNVTPHGETGVPPNNVNDTNKEDVWHRLYERRSIPRRHPPKLSPGDHVRVSKARRAFERGYTANWTEEVFVVRRVLQHNRPVVYEIEDLDGEEVRGTFYEQELQRVDRPETFRIEKVVRTRRGRAGREALVKWLGYPDKFNSWIAWPTGSQRPGKRRG